MLMPTIWPPLLKESINNSHLADGDPVEKKKIRMESEAAKYKTMAWELVSM